MSRQVLVRNNGDSVEKFAFLAPLASAAVGAVGRAAATKVGQTALGQGAKSMAGKLAQSKVGQMAGKVASKTKGVLGEDAGKKIAEAGAAMAQMQQQKQQAMQEQNQQMADKAKAGSQITTGEPMDMAWRILKAKELKDFLQEYPDVKFQSDEIWDDAYTEEPFSYGKTTHGKQSSLSPMEESAARRTMNPQRMAMLQRFLGRSKAKPTIAQQVHGNVEDPYFVPTEMENPPMRTETSYPQGENDSYNETIDFDFPYTQAQVDEHNRRFNIQQGEPMDMTWRMLKSQLLIR